MGVEVYVYQDHVTVDFTGVDRVLAMKGHLDLSMYDLEAATVMSIDEARQSVGLPRGGAYVPGRVATGHFPYRDRPGALQLWCTYRDDEVLVIDTCLPNPARVVLQHPARDDLAWLIGERIPLYT